MSDDDLLRRGDVLDAIEFVDDDPAHRFEKPSADDYLMAIRRLPSPGSSDPAVLFRSKRDEAAVALAEAYVALKDFDLRAFHARHAAISKGPPVVGDKTRRQRWAENNDTYRVVSDRVDDALARFRAADAEEKS